MKETYSAEYKTRSQITTCEVGREIALIYNDSQWHGIFRGLDGDSTIMLKSTGENPSVLGFPLEGLNFWLLKDKPIDHAEDV